MSTYNCSDIETAVVTCADANDLVRRILLGTHAGTTGLRKRRVMPAVGLCVKGQRMSVKRVVLAEHDERPKDLDRQQGYCHSIRHFGRKPSPRTARSL